METRLWAGRLEFNSRQGKRRDIFIFATACRPALRPTEPHIQLLTGALTPGVKGAGRETEHSPPSPAEIKNAWS
jgi:hypothetical protein